MAKVGHDAKAIYSLSKMVSLGQKLKMRKGCEKRSYQNIRFVVCKKTAPKNN